MFETLKSKIGLGLVALATLAASCAAARASGEPIAGPWIDLHGGTRARLIGTSVPAGAQSAQVGAALELVLAEGWKTYWRMPGDAGVPPTFDWQASANLAAVKVLYPAPERIPEAGAEIIGYKKHVIFPVQVTPKGAGPVGLKLELELGVCKEICVPAQAEFAIVLPRSEAPAPMPAVLADAVAKVPAAPRAGAPVLVDKTAVLEGPEPRLRLQARFPGGGEGADLFIEAPDSIYVPLPRRNASKDKDIAVFDVTLSPSLAKDLKGKELRVTLVMPQGPATEQVWQLP